MSWPCSRRRGSPQPGSDSDSESEPKSPRLSLEALSARRAPAAPRVALWAREGNGGESFGGAGAGAPRLQQPRCADSCPCSDCRVLAGRFLRRVLLGLRNSVGGRGARRLLPPAAAAAAGRRPGHPAARRVGSHTRGAGAWSLCAAAPRRTRATRAPGQRRIPGRAGRGGGHRFPPPRPLRTPAAWRTLFSTLHEDGGQGSLGHGDGEGPQVLCPEPG